MNPTIPGHTRKSRDFNRQETNAMKFHIFLVTSEFPSKAWDYVRKPILFLLDMWKDKSGVKKSVSGKHRDNIWTNFFNEMKRN